MTHWISVASTAGAYVAAAVSGGFALRAGKIAREANQLSKRSNALASDANALADGANEIARQALDHQTENHDVHWVLKWPFDGVLHLRNDGQDEAREVVATVTTGLRERRLTQEKVLGLGGFLTVDMQEEYKQALEARSDHDRDHGPRSIRTGLGPPVIQMSGALYIASGYVRLRVTWQTDLGKLNTQELSAKYCDFDAE